MKQRHEKSVWSQMMRKGVGIRQAAQIPQPPDDLTGQSLSIDTVPNVWADVNVYDATDDNPARVFLVGFEGESFVASQQLLREAAGSEIEEISADDRDQVETVFSSMAKESFPWTRI